MENETVTLSRKTYHEMLDEIETLKQQVEEKVIYRYHDISTYILTGIVTFGLVYMFYLATRNL